MRLRETKETLLSLEDDMTAAETRSEFGPGYIGLSRALLATIARRREIKREINAHLGADIGEI